LSRLDLSHNYIAGAIGTREEGVEALMCGVRGNWHLTRLDLTHNRSGPVSRVVLHLFLFLFQAVLFSFSFCFCASVRMYMYMTDSINAVFV
jgi:hypothetical protein